MNVFKHYDASFAKQLDKLCASLGQSADVSATVTRIITDIRAKGDRAVLACTKEFDRVVLKASQLKVAEADLAKGLKTLSVEHRKAIREAIKCVKDFHKRTLPKSWRAKNPHGATVGEEFYPLQRVGIYVPGGQVPLVSSVIMSAILAKIAGVPEIVVCTPPGADGQVAPGLLAALHLCGVKEVYKIGGVQAIAAMAIGTKTVPPVDKVFGPGNAFVMEAKRQLYGVVGVDLLPGPSEVMVIADHRANARYVAADLLAQAEHGTGKEKIYLLVTSETKLRAIEREIEKQTPSLVHADAIRSVLNKSFYVFVCKHMQQMVEIANRIAPEHMELQVEEQHHKHLIKEIKTAGAILVGSTTATALGDFTAGPSHTLPTERTGRFSSGMQVTDYMRRSSVVQYDAKSIRKAAPVVSAFAVLEQLDGHGRSVEMRASD